MVSETDIHQVNTNKWKIRKEENIQLLIFVDDIIWGYLSRNSWELTGEYQILSSTIPQKIWVLRLARMATWFTNHSAWYKWMSR